MGLVHKIARSCQAAHQILNSIEQHRQSSIGAKPGPTTGDSKIFGGLKQQQQDPIRRYQWIKFALIEKKLIAIIEYLIENGNKYYDEIALISDDSCSQILLSLLAGPSALDYSHNKIGDVQFQEDPTALDLIKRHKLANPIVCLCKHEQQQPELRMNTNHDCDGRNDDLNANNKPEAAKTQLNGDKNKQPTDSAAKSSRVRSSSLNRRRPLSIKTNPRRPTLITECRHYSCQEITEHQQSRGYSLFCTNLHTPLSAPTSIGPFTQSQNQLQQQATRSNISNTSQGNNRAKLINQQTPTQSSQHQDDRCWSLWSPRILHEIMYQNSKFRLIYGKNNISLENDRHSYTAGYLSLHETDQDIILKWIPNRMINGSQHQRQHDYQTNHMSNLEQDDYNSDDKGLNSSNSVDNPTPIESSFLELVVSIPMSTIVLLHCHFRSSSIEMLDDKEQDDTNEDQVSTTKKDIESDMDNQSNVFNNNDTSNEETLILFEADGVQRAPFKFPKGGLRLFLSCLEASLAPDRYLEPAISLDPIGQWPQSPFETPLPNGSLRNQAGRSTPLGHSSSLGDKPAASSSPINPHQNSSKDQQQQQEEPCLGRLDILLRRLPSLKRKTTNNNTTKPHSLSSVNDDSVLASKNHDDDTNVFETRAPDNHLASTNNYVYRIVYSSQQQNQQSDSSILTSTEGSIASSPGFIGRSSSIKKSSNNTSNHDAGFRWNFRRWTNFSRPSAGNSSSSTLSSSFGPQNPDLIPNKQHQLSSDLTLDQATNLTSDFDEASPRDCARSSSDDEEQILKDLRGHSSIDDNSIKLARVEAKLNELKKSTSEEVLEIFRTQSIQTLCDSMRKQIVARAFYGWLVHCRRSKMIHEHLSHLLKPIDNDKLMQRMLYHQAPGLTSQDDKQTTIGLTQDKWEKLMNMKNGKEGEKNEQETAKEISDQVGLDVYLGGIRDNELRKKVWPYLLKQYQYSDVFEERSRKDATAQKEYDNCVSEWSVIEREVKQRDNEILEANIARAKQESSTKKQQQEMGLVSSSVANDDIGMTKICPTTATMDTSQSKLSEICESTDDELNQEAKTSAIDKPEADKSQPGEPPIANQESEKIVLENIHLINDEKKGEHSDASTIVQDDERNKPNRLDNAKSKPQTGRWRLESTGSVGSDEPITNQFGNNIHRIDKDVQRCDRQYWYFKDKQNLDKLRNIMCTYVWQNLKVGYVQGMCDLAAPFLVIFDNEVDAFQCFNQLMKRMVENFPLGSAMDQYFEALKYLIQVMDPKLFQVLQCNNDDNSCFYFCYRWLLLDFKRELSYADVFLVWETIWAARDVATDQFVVFLALAMVRYYRDIIIENDMDYTDTLKFFNEMAEKHDVRRILELARESVNELYTLLLD